jgi:hypothetical protein
MDKTKVIAKLYDPDFWRALAYLATAFGIALKPEQQQAIITAGLGISGFLHAFFPTNPKP